MLFLIIYKSCVIFDKERKWIILKICKVGEIVIYLCVNFSVMVVIFFCGRFVIRLFIWDLIFFINL